MNMTMKGTLGAGATALALSLLGGCETERETRVVQTDRVPATAPGPEAPAGERVADVRRVAHTQNAIAIPSGDTDSSMLLIRTQAPETIVAGQPFDYTLEVTNISDMVLQDVELTHTVPSVGPEAGQRAAVRVRDSAPAADRTPDGRETWNIGTLGPQETKTVRVTATAEEAGMLRQCFTADYKPHICVVSNVIAPDITLTMAGPEMLTVCEEALYTITVANRGVGAAQGVTVDVDLPAGLHTPDGRNALQIPVGDLAEGQARQFEVALVPERTGQLTPTAVATSDLGLTAEAQATTVFTQPELEVALQAPQQDYIGVPVEFTATVTNVSDTPAENVVIVASAPQGLDIEEAMGGRLQGDTAVWNLGRLEPGATRDLSFLARGTAPGEAATQIIATAECAADATAMATAELVGVPALLLEMVDVEDPIRVGLETQYRITVLNQGSEPATNVQVRGMLQQGVMEFVSADGPTQTVSTGQEVVFAPLPTLAPGDTATWVVVVRGTSAADARFAAQMSADQLGQDPVEEREPTRFYGPNQIQDQPAGQTPGQGQNQGPGG